MRPKGLRSRKGLLMQPMSSTELLERQAHIRRQAAAARIKSAEFVSQGHKGDLITQMTKAAASLDRSADAHDGLIRMAMDRESDDAQKTLRRARLMLIWKIGTPIAILILIVRLAWHARHA